MGIMNATHAPLPARKGRDMACGAKKTIHLGGNAEVDAVCQKIDGHSPPHWAGDEPEADVTVEFRWYR